MTGRELIIYILQNDLENEEVIKDGKFAWLITESQVASKFGVGVNTVKTWHDMGFLEGFRLGETLYFLANITDPRKHIK